MQFIDTITPSSPQQYISTVQNYPGGGDTKRQQANDWATMYYQNAYNTAMQNYMNLYNTPLEQMKRYQDAGLSQWLAQGDPGNMSSSPSGAAPKGNFKAPSNLETAQVVSSQALQVLQSAGEIYDYLKFGAPLKQSQLHLAELNNNIAWQNMRKYTAEANWAEYWNNGPEYFHLLNGDNAVSPSEGSPRAVYMQNSSDFKAKQIDQLSFLIENLYPSQVEQNLATAALKAYQKQILEGQNGAILQIDTGNQTADSILKFVCFWINNNFGSLMRFF